jgi:hypothetical protein
LNPRALLDLAPLPAAVTSLLDSFTSSHGCADVKVWGRSGGDWVCVYPQDDADFHAAAAGDRHRIELRNGDELEIQLAGGDAQDADIRFL